MPRRFTFPALLLAAAVLAAPVEAGVRIQSLESIRDAVLTHLAAAPGRAGDEDYQVGRLDPRLRLAPCPVALDTFNPPGARRLGNTTVGVRCPSGRPWTLYVPARVNAYRDVVVLRTPLARGTAIERDHLAVERREISALSGGYFGSPEAVVGQVLKRAGRSGEAPTPAWVEAPRLVRRGDRVVLLARSGALEIKTRAVALEHGIAGARIKVRNVRSRRVVDGVVIDTGVVRAAL